MSINQEKVYLYTAVIVEPRKHPAMSFVLHNFCTNLSDEWQFIIFHGALNKEYIEDIINKYLRDYKNKIKLIKLNINNLDINMYNKLLRSFLFYESISTETFLIFQTDSIIFSGNKKKINDFLEYDYVGAPWKSNQIVGNGGLSLRKKSKMIEILTNKPNKDDHENEDLYFSNYDKINKPPFEKAKEFSVESTFYHSPFGIHRAWDYLNKYEYRILKSKYPEIDILRKINKKYKMMR